MKEVCMAEPVMERSAVVGDDTAHLHKLGYAQELFRSMGGFQNFAISFTIISILAGCLTSYTIGYNQGGPVAITWGWLIVGLACTLVALAMGEIASTYPTAGGLYFWASKLGSPAWGWFTGWFNLIGQIAVTAAIGFGCAIFMTSLLNLLWSYPNSYGWIYFLYGLILLGAGLINMFKVPITAFLNTISAWWYMLVVLVVVGILFAVLLPVAVTFAIPAKGPSDTGTFIVQSIWQDSMGRRWAEFLLFIAVVAQSFCTIASVTSASRMMFAFSRDRAVPGHQLWHRVSKRDRIPVYTVWGVCVLAFLTPLPALWFGYVGYAASTAVAVIGLYIAFVLPIILRLRAGESFERGAWHLGRHYKWIDWIAILWITFISVIFLAPSYFLGIPWNKGFDWNYVNYTIIMVGGAFLLFGGWYVLSAHKWFKGPIRQGSEEELGRIEAEYEPGKAAPA